MTDLHRILYVEDDHDIQLVARLALEAVGGFEVRLCSSGEEGLAAATADPPDLLLLDVMMPSMDGPSTLSAMREVESLANVPAVFITAKVQPNEVDHYISLGALGIIAKPFDPMTLADTVRSIWATRPTD
jgi:CheY-like chemotaxis protein